MIDINGRKREARRISKFNVSTLSTELSTEDYISF